MQNCFALVMHTPLCLSALIRKQHTAELHLGDFLVFLRRVVSSKAIQSKMASPKWTEVLLNIAAQKCCSGTGCVCMRCSEYMRPARDSVLSDTWRLVAGVPLVGNLRTRLLALHVLEAVLPACEANMEDDQMTQVGFERASVHTLSLQTVVGWVGQLLLSPAGGGAALLLAVRLHVGGSRGSGQTLGPGQREGSGAQAAGKFSFLTPGLRYVAAVSVTGDVLDRQGDAEEEDENLPIQEVSFDPEKAQCCVVENGQGLTHGSGGKGYGLASTGISSGCYQWKVWCCLGPFSGCCPCC